MFCCGLLKFAQLSYLPRGQGAVRGAGGCSGRAGGADGGAAGIRAAVVAERAGPRAPAAPLQHARVEVGVATRVLRQVVAPHEALLADGAAELLLTRVRAIVPRQLVRARELLVALLPAAGEGPLTCGRQEQRLSLGHASPSSQATASRHPQGPFSHPVTSSQRTPEMQADDRAEEETGNMADSGS